MEEEIALFPFPLFFKGKKGPEGEGPIRISFLL